MRFHDPAVRSEHEHLLDQLVDEMRAFPWTGASCPVCEDGTPEPALEKWGITVCRCSVCGHLLVSPRMPQEAVPALYGSRYWHAHALATGCPPLSDRVRFDYENAQTKLNRDVLPYRSGGRLLDVGASNGGLVRRACENGFAAVGLEPSAEICALARSAHGVEMHCGTLLDDLFEPASFDVITLHDVLEHLLEPGRDLAEAARLLAPGGLLVIETLTSSSLELAELGAAWPLLSPLEHPHYFSEHGGAVLVERAGLALLDLYSPHENNWIAIAERSR